MISIILIYLKGRKPVKPEGISSSTSRIKPSTYMALSCAPIRHAPVWHISWVTIDAMISKPLTERSINANPLKWRSRHGRSTANVQHRESEAFVNCEKVGLNRRPRIICTHSVTRSRTGVWMISRSTTTKIAAELNINIYVTKYPEPKFAASDIPHAHLLSTAKFRYCVRNRL